MAPLTSTGMAHKNVPKVPTNSAEAAVMEAFEAYKKDLARVSGN